MNSVRVFAPATVANVNIGFDLLGYAIKDVGDIVTVEKIDKPEVIIESISGVSGLPLEAEKNTAGKPLLKLIADKQLDFGFKVSIEKGIPMGSGMGGSAASAVGAIVAAHELMDENLSQEELLAYALEGEAVASGSKHPDNVVPCLYGGLCLTTSMNPSCVIKLPTPDIISLSFHPHVTVKTSESRNLLRKEILLSEHTLQMSQLAGFIAGAFKGDLKLIKKHFNDFIVEPQRSQLIDGFDQAKAKAIELNAIGFGISGSGPSLFGWCKNNDEAEIIKKEILQLLSHHHAKVDSWSGAISEQGARIL